MISNSMSTAASGLFAQRSVVDTISKNIANVNSEGYKRLNATTQEIDGGAGVTVTISQEDQPWVDRNLQNSSMDLASSVSVKDSIDRMDNLMFNSNVETSYSSFLTAAKNLQSFPESKQFLQEFNSAGSNLNDAINQTATGFVDLRNTIQNRVDLQQVQLDALKQQLTQISSQGAINNDNANQVSMIQQRIASLTGSVTGYNRFLNSIMPPITKDFTAITTDLKNTINAAGGQVMFDLTGGWNNQTSVDNNSVVNNQKVLDFPDEIGRMKTLIGSVANKAILDNKWSQNNFDQASKDYNNIYGVDLEKETVKLLDAQRLYEANSKVLQASDGMIGTLLDIMG
ncbi:Flagellar basal-body/hook protein, C-terminal domain containing protein [uncultured Caudovirales phage]|uniref:Flagellar basal-body/hook protein, C-terminal domain containing protein n=1 Tax=uncultured Caudovirales phage TaxID=2100421 RepID=A0A6J5L8W0_9CAUD|nr:Flagellar basal-body/hook protein, C-terminal domain containing protein [uncultured Caudovirales phage]